MVKELALEELGKVVSLDYQILISFTSGVTLILI